MERLDPIEQTILLCLSSAPVNRYSFLRFLPQPSSLPRHGLGKLTYYFKLKFFFFSENLSAPPPFTAGWFQEFLDHLEPGLSRTKFRMNDSV